jgi:hypothetical protein
VDTDFEASRSNQDPKHLGDGHFLSVHTELALLGSSSVSEPRQKFSPVCYVCQCRSTPLCRPLWCESRTLGMTGAPPVHAFPLQKWQLPRPAGPFWITSYAPLVVRDYNSLRARYMKRKGIEATGRRSLRSLPLGHPQLNCLANTGKGVKSRPTYHFASSWRMVYLSGRVVQVVADREWFVVISGGTLLSCSSCLRETDHVPR